MRKSKSEYKVGVIGLGLMGSALADALVDQNLDILVWNRSREKCVRYAEEGTKVASSPQEVAAEYLGHYRRGIYLHVDCRVK